MNKEELEKEADEYATGNDICVCGDEYWSYNDMKQAYLAGAEPREKRIAELEAQIENYKLSEIEAKEIMAEQEAQIEKMKVCCNCYWSNYLPNGNCLNCDGKKNWKLKEIKEK